MKLRISLDDRTFEVDVEVAESDHANLPPAYPVGSARLAGSAAGAQPGTTSGPGALRPPAAVADEGKACRSPVSGVVVKVLATAGATIKAGDSLLVLEAMKMETHIVAPLSGEIASIRVAKGDRVQTGDVLVEFV